MPQTSQRIEIERSGSVPSSHLRTSDPKGIEAVARVTGLVIAGAIALILLCGLFYAMSKSEAVFDKYRETATPIISGLAFGILGFAVGQKSGRR
jgi:hypothetical protein